MNSIVKKVSTELQTVRGKSLLLTSAMIAGTAGAQTSGTTGSTAVTGLGLENMIQSAADGIRALISANSGPLLLALLPVMAFFFIWGRIRSLF